MRADSNVIESAEAIRGLGVIIDAQLSMRKHVARTAQACFFQLHRLRFIRQQLGRDITVKLVVALVFARLDYCSAILASFLAVTLVLLQQVIHAAAHLVNGLRPHDHVTPTFKELHWLLQLDASTTNCACSSTRQWLAKHRPAGQTC
jgi:hypothetical protein